MRIPAGAPVPFWMGLKNRLPKGINSKFSTPTMGTVAVAVTVMITGAAVFAVCVYPKLNNDFYKKAQAEERALLHATREQLAGSQRAWSDPFDRPAPAKH